MAPHPVWEDRPAPAWIADPTVTSGAPVPTEPLPFVTKVNGKGWKQPKVKKAPGNLAPEGGGKGMNKKWKEKEEKRSKEDAVKRLEREMKEERIAELERKKLAHQTRKAKVAEKERLAEMAARMSAKKLQRMKKRLGRGKKVNQ